MTVHNFSAGPGVLPKSVIEEIRSELPYYKRLGTSVLEISHRTEAYAAIEHNARRLLKKLLGLEEDWHILFLTGGASTQFYQVPMNFLNQQRIGAYVDTGVWSSNAIKESKKFGKIQVVASGEKNGYVALPKQNNWEPFQEAHYLHFTSNNTIYGTQFHEVPKTEGVPIVCDASSDILSKQMSFERFGLLYAGAQKNIGTAGVTLVLVRDSFLETQNKQLPTMLDYRVHAQKLFNTPPVFAIYVLEKVLRWLDNLGGVETIEKDNQKKASLLYNTLDQSSFYKTFVAKEDRSLMNVCFRLEREALEDKFVEEATENGLLFLKGHRNSGGIRASLYNACPYESVEVLVSFMNNFEQQFG